jgi:DNA-binding GntR family transcriptional regulator
MSPSAMKRIADALRARIVTAQLAPGTHLHQAEVANEFGVSRIPVRDALQALAAENLVDLTPAGAMVSAMSVEVLDELYELRGLVEPRATALGVPMLGRSDLRVMRECDALMRGTSDPVAWLDANSRFHRAIYEKSGRPRWIALVESLRSQTDRYLHLHLAVIGNTAHLHDEHARLMAAAEARDAAAVEALTRGHLQSSHDFILEYLAAAEAEDGHRSVVADHEQAS